MVTGALPELDADTRLERVAAGRYRGDANARWSVGPALNGGYALVLGLRAIAAEVGHPDPLSVTGHFLAALEPGPVDIDVEVVKDGRHTATATAALRQGERERVRVLALCGRLPAEARPLVREAEPPALPPLEECVEPSAEGTPGSDLAIAERIRYRHDPQRPGQLAGQPTGRPRLATWARFADDRPNDLLGLVCLVDALPPVIGEAGIAGWVPTLELTVHLRAHPAPGWLRCALAAQAAQAGLVDETCEVWDADGQLVATARQLARLP